MKRSVLSSIIRSSNGVPNKNTLFAEGYSFYKLVCLFFISAAAGDAIETVFMYITTQKWVCRSSVVFGRFSLVWGLGCVLLTLLLSRIGKKKSVRIFLIGAVLGGIYEYFSSVFTEVVFGTVFWNYSHLPFNIGGRVTLPYCLFWGIAAVLWMKAAYPLLSRGIESIPAQAGKWICNLLIAFMLFNVLISGAALIRYTQRYQGIEPSNQLGEYIDAKFPDERMEEIYPYARFRVEAASSTDENE